MPRRRDFYVYITSNPSRTVLYIGVTNNLERRMSEHYENRGTKNSFAGKFYCYELIYWEHYNSILEAIAREKQLKRWSRKKKETLIERMNPRWLRLKA